MEIFNTMNPCKNCKGMGKVKGRYCPECNGTGEGEIEKPGQRWKADNVRGHHPFCAKKYIERMNNSWGCRCDYLHEYDQWRQDNDI